jgi:hypothetical protein
MQLVAAVIVVRHAASVSPVALFVPCIVAWLMAGCTVFC